MPAIALTSSMLIEIDNVLHQIFGRPKHDKINMVRVDTQDNFEISQTELLYKIDQGTAEIKCLNEPDEMRKKRLQARLKRDLSQLDDRLSAELKRRLAYVKRVNKYMPISKTVERLNPIIEEVAAKTGDREPPHWTTVCHWLRAYKAGVKDPRSLIPSFSSRGNRKSQLPKEVLDAINQAIDVRYLTRQQDTPSAVMDNVVCQIGALNAYRSDAEKLPVPSKRTIYRHIKKIAKFERTEKRHGKAAADRQFQTPGTAPRATRPLERVEIDHTVLDLFLVDEETLLPIGRPTLTMAIDTYSRLPIGFYLGFEPPSWAAVMHCLRHAFLPKSNLLSLFPSINHEWLCSGIPETIVVDNGKEFHSDSFELACEQLGIQIQYSPRKAPWYKGAVERQFGTINTRLLAGRRGRTFTECMEGEEYNPQRDAVIGIRQFTEGLCKWIVDDFAQSFHRGLNDIPAEVWKAGVENHPGIRLPTTTHDISALLATAGEKPIHKYGIELNSLIYKSTELSGLRIQLCCGRSPKITVKYDPSDISKIYVKNPDSGDLFQVPARDTEYTYGLNFWQHRVIVRWRNKQIRRGHTDLTLATAREQIRDILSKARVLNIPTASSRNCARHDGIGSNQVLNPGDQYTREAQPVEVLPPTDEVVEAAYSDNSPKPEDEILDLLETDNDYHASSSEGYPA